MKKIISAAIVIGTLGFAFGQTNADHHGEANNGSFVIPKAEVDSTLLQGLTNLAAGRSVSDIVVRHVDVGDEYMGVSVVQRSKVDITATETGISHTDLDEIYYIVAGAGTMVTGGAFIEPTELNSNLLGPMLRGEIHGGVLQKVEVGDIAIIPKGMPHGWHEISSDTISYIIFRGDPNEVMAIKNSGENRIE